MGRDRSGERSARAPEARARPSPGVLGPRALGVAEALVGVVLLVVAPGSTALVSGLAAAGLMLVGLVYLVRALPGPGRSGSPVPVALGGVLVAVGVVALVWRDASVRTLAAVLSVGLIGHGLVWVLGREPAAESSDRGAPAGDATPSACSDRGARLLLGAASVALGVVVLVWPRLSLHVVAMLVGTWLVLVGLGAALRGTRLRRRVGAPRRLVPAVASVLVAGLLLAGTVWVHDGDPRVVPDAFYTPPASVPDEPGRLIRSRPMTAGVPDGLQAWLLLYTTTDGAGAPAVASGTVLAPGAAPDGALPVVAVGHGTTGVVPRCAPSLADAPFADGAGAALSLIVRAGHVAVTSDYIGLGTAGPHAYLVGADAAHAVLDAVRAARELTDVEVSERVVAWGHSQGGHAVLWAGMLAADYAPELELLGVAAFAPASDLHALADGLRSESIGKLVGAYIAGSWDAAFPDLEVRSQLTPTYGGIVDRLTGLCFTGRDVVAALATATQLSREVFAPGALDGPLGERLRQNSPDGDIPVPVLLAQGDADPLVLPEQQARFVAARCAEGMILDSRVYPGLDHLSLVAADSPLSADVLEWTAARFAGEPAVAACETRAVR